MLILVLGLAIFIGTHSVRLVTPNWRELTMSKKGLISWKLRFGLLSTLSLGFIVMGYAQSRHEPVWLWFPPVFMQHISSLIMLVALFFLMSALVPKTTMKRLTRYPAYLAIKLWAFAHLMSNGSLADVVLFGSFLAWAIVSYAVFRRRDRLAGVAASESNVRFDLIALVFTFGSWFAIVAFLHKALIGVAPLG